LGVGVGFAGVEERSSRSDDASEYEVAPDASTDLSGAAGSTVAAMSA
jgi:hypothetical protein